MKYLGENMDTQTMMTNRESIKLDIAFEWVCPVCEIRNFSRGFGAEFDSDTTKLLCKYIDKKEVESLKRIPANVRCNRCGKRYKAEI